MSRTLCFFAHLTSPHARPPADQEELHIRRGTSLLLFGGLLLCKVLHWILDSRVNYLETQPAISRLQHARLASFLAILAVCDYHLLLFSVSRALARPYSVVLFFAFEYIKLVVLDAYILLKYAVATASHAIPSWDGRSAAVMYLELLHSFALAVLVTGFFMVVLSGRHFPIHMIHEVIVTADSFRRRLVKVLKYRAVMANVGSAFSDATQVRLVLSLLRHHAVVSPAPLAYAPFVSPVSIVFPSRSSPWTAVPH